MSQSENNTLPHDPDVRPEVISFADVVEACPRAASHRRLVERLFRWLSIDKVNDVHSRYCHHRGARFATDCLRDFDITLRVDGRETLESMPADKPFITVSNHPFGALDGISLVSLVGSLRPDFKVMVNMVLNRITAMATSFIAVDALASDDPTKKAVSVNGIRQAIRQVRSGAPLGFFPAGAVGKVNRHGEIMDREWQPTVVRLIRQLKVPVVPVFFHGKNSWLFNFLGVVCWQLRTLRLPTEIWRKCHSTIHISVGDPITPEEIAAFGDDDKALGQYLKDKTFSLRDKQ